MKQYSFKKFTKLKKKNENRHKRSLKFAIIILLFMLIITFIALYIGNMSFRNFIDVYILRKEVYENNASSLTVDSSDVSFVYAFNNHILILDNDTLSFYDSSAKLSKTLNITLSNPIADSNGKYLILGDYNFQKFYLIHNNDVEWEKTVEGTILKVNVNKNGYVSVIASSTLHESIVIVYDPSGKELFKYFLSSTYAIASDISDNNTYLAIAQVDYSGINIQSKVEVLSIDSAINDKENAIVNTFSADIGKLILDIHYQSNDNLYCQLDDSILCITPNSSNVLFSKSDSTLFLTSNISDCFVRIDKESSGVLNSDYRMKITDSKGAESVYIIEDTVKEMKTSDNIIAINFGKQINFINTNGWLLKKYISSREIQDVIFSDNIAAIIYKDKIDIITI